VTGPIYRVGEKAIETRLIWSPTLLCQNYSPGRSYGDTCPYCCYGWDPQAKRFLYEGQPTMTTELAPYADVLGFLWTNASTFDHYVEVTGGEPLLYPHLADMLGRDLSKWQWGITSNTQNTVAIRQLIDASGGHLMRCMSWTASYHPFASEAKRAAFAANITQLRFAMPGRLSVTLVVSRHTLPVLDDAVAFLRRLPLDGIQHHVAIQGSDPEERRQLIARGRELFGVEAVVDSVPPVPNRCDRHASLLFLASDGNLYPCLTYGMLAREPIGRATADLRVADLPAAVKGCPVPCCAVCDHIKLR